MGDRRLQALVSSLRTPVSSLVAGGAEMRAVVQRVRRAAVNVGERAVAQIGPGVVIFVGVGKEDGEDEAGWMAEKIAHLRVFEDVEGRMDRSLLEIGGEALVISQFTLYGDVRKGRRPDFTAAAGSAEAEPMYQRFIQDLRGRGVPVQSGVFGARMLVEIENDGPVTLLLETPDRRHQSISGPRTED